MAEDPWEENGGEAASEAWADSAVILDNLSAAGNHQQVEVQGKRFLEINGERSFWLLTIARWAYSVGIGSVVAVSVAHVAR